MAHSAMAFNHGIVSVYLHLLLNVGVNERGHVLFSYFHELKVQEVTTPQREQSSLRTGQYVPIDFHIRLKGFFNQEIPGRQTLSDLNSLQKFDFLDAELK
jgi:hypothetical protein